MFSVNNFYNYLNQYLKHAKKDVDLKTFSPHGSRLLKDIIIPAYDINTIAPKRFIGQAAMFDQEPIELEYFTNWIEFDSKSFPEGYEYRETGDLYKHLTPTEFIFRHFSGVYNPILLHSERNSPEVELFAQNNFHPVHYFYHGLIARDWFRHWIHYNMDPGTNAKRLGMYCRDATGSRAYRLDLIEKLIPYKHNLHFQLQEPVYTGRPVLVNHFQINTTVYDSTASATIVPEDCQKFDIQIVPETLFDTQKTHLTEKIFKPIVMEQPFILVGPPNSLAYLKSYGFRTFEDCWDESYDKETDSVKRMEKIIKLVHDITSMEPRAYREMMQRARWCAMYNRKRMAGGVVETRMLEELHTNLDVAIAARDEEYQTMPGGTYFKYQDQLQKAGHDITEFNLKRNQAIIKYLGDHDRDTAVKIMNKYQKLF